MTVDHELQWFLGEIPVYDFCINYISDFCHKVLGTYSFNNTFEKLAIGFLTFFSNASTQVVGDVTEQ